MTSFLNQRESEENSRGKLLACHVSKDQSRWAQNWQTIIVATRYLKTRLSTWFCFLWFGRRSWMINRLVWGDGRNKTSAIKGINNSRRVATGYPISRCGLYTGISIIRTFDFSNSRFFEPKVVSLGFASVRFLPQFWNFRFIEPKVVS